MRSRRSVLDELFIVHTDDSRKLGWRLLRLTEPACGMDAGADVVATELPERWLGNQAQRGFTYVPFGIGPRVCIGQHFAMAETVLGLASMLRRFSFSPTFLSSCRGQRMDLSSAKKKYQTTSATAKQSGAPELIHKIRMPARRERALLFHAQTNCNGSSGLY
jgi:hypothetical protein